MAKKKSSSSKGPKKGGDDVDFEAALAEVERIVNQLESGELDLTASLEQYEMGVKYLKSCQDPSRSPPITARRPDCRQHRNPTRS